MDIDKHVLPYMPWLKPDEQVALRADLPLTLREAHTQARRPVGVQTDPYVQSYAEAYESLIERFPSFAIRAGDLALRQPIKRYAKDELGVSVSSVWGLGRMAMMSNVLAARRRNPQAPNPLNNPEPRPRDWHAEWPRIANDPVRLEHFDYALTMLNTPTTVSDRQAIVHMMTQMLGSGPVDVMAVGVGTGHGEVRQLHLREYPFEKAEVMEYAPRSFRGVRQQDAELTRRYGEYLRRPSLLRKIVMVDMMDIYDPVTRLSAEGALRIQSELLNPEFMWRYHGLTYFMDDQREHGGGLLDFHRVDFADEEQVERLRDELQGQKFNFVTFVTMLNQEADPAVRSAMLRRAESFLNDDEHAAIIIIDFFWQQGRKLVPYKNWRRWDFNAFMIQKQDPAKRPEHLITARDSRGRCLEPGKGSLIVNGKRRKFEALWREGYTVRG